MVLRAQWPLGTISQFSILWRRKKKRRQKNKGILWLGYHRYPSNNLHFITYFIHRGQSPNRQQPIKEPSLKYYPFLLFNVSSLIRDRRIHLWLRSIRGTTDFQLSLRSKITRNYIFEVTSSRRIILIFSVGRTAVRVISFTTVFWFRHATSALSQTRYRGRCVTRPNKGCKGDNSKRGTDAFHLYSERFRQ